MKFLTWNIWSGGFGDYSYDLAKPKRLNEIQKVISDVDADFVSLIDTFRWDTHFKKDELVDLFGYENVYCINLEDERLKKLGHNNGITVLTRTESPHFETIRISTRNAIKTTVELKGEQMDIFSIYFDDQKEGTRIRQYEDLKKFITYPERSIITGDFNSASPDEVESTRERLYSEIYEKYPPLKERFEEQINDMLRGELISNMQKDGFIDADERGTSTIPTPLKMPDVFLRLDYAFVGSEIDIEEFKVVKNETSDMASDHYPIMFELK